MKRKKKIVIVGGGITGMTLAYALRHHETVLMEASPRLGGWIRTLQHSDFLFEAGPRAIRSQHQETLALVKELGLPLLRSTKAASKKFIVHHNQLEPFSMRHALRGGVCSAILCDWKQRPQPRQEESIGAFSRRHFGENWTRSFIDPMVRGIFGSSIEELSTSCCFPRLWALDQTKGSVIPSLLASLRTSQALFSFQEGMETLVQALSHHIPSTLLNTPMTSFQTGVVESGTTAIEGDLILLALPAWRVAPLMEIPSIPYVSLRLVHLGWHHDCLRHRGYGFLVPSSMSTHLMGMTFDSALFPTQPGATRITAFFPGEITEQEAREIALHITMEWCQIPSKPDWIQSSLAQYALPKYELGYLDRLTTLQSYLPNGVIYIGSGCLGTGVEGAIQRALRLARSI